MIILSRLFCAGVARRLVVALGLATVAAVTPLVATVYTFSHLAGAPGGRGVNDGVGSAAHFNQPVGIASDQAGNFYVTDIVSHTIRKITPAGEVTTFAGRAGFSGHVDGSAGAARFSAPQAVSVGPDGSVYVADGDFTIRKITPDRFVTTLAGRTNESGSVDGVGDAARFGSLQGVAADAGGNLYVADTGNYAIRKISPAGAVTTLAGGASTSGYADGVGTAARFSGPRGIAVDGAGNLYVTDSLSYTSSHGIHNEFNSVIRRITSAGVVTTIAGAAGSPGNVDGEGGVARFNHPVGVAVDAAGNLYVADRDNRSIRRITAAGQVTTVVGAAGAQFSYPTGVALDASGGICVADTGSSTIARIAPDGAVTLLAGAPATPSGTVDGVGSAAQFEYPMSVAVDLAGNVYMGDSVKAGIRRVASDGTVSTLAAAVPANGIAVDDQGNVYASDSRASVVRKLTPAGVVTILAGAVGQAGRDDGVGVAARFVSPHALALDRSGNLYVTDDNTIRKITPAGLVSTLAGSPGHGSVDGLGTAARFNNPEGVAVDRMGNVYVADTFNNTIRKITPQGLVSTLAGLADGSGNRGEDGIGAAAKFSLPTGIAVDEAGNIFVVDSDHQTIRKIKPDGWVMTVGGWVDHSGGTDGTGAEARFSAPAGIAIDASGNLYVADSGNRSVRKGVPSASSPLINLSTRTQVGTGDAVAIAGFVITGSRSKQVLIRACGPALATTFGLNGVLADPLLKLCDHTGAEINRNAGWGGDAAIKAAAQRVGAFAWADPSADAALLVTLAPGLYSAQVSGRSGDTGIAMVEVYDADDDAARNATGSGRLVNLSTRSTAGTGANVQIAGFVIAGECAKQVLIRAGGPILSTAFHMTGVLATPVLTLCDHNGAAIDQNTGWSSDAFAAAALRATAARVGAYAWPADSADSALLVTLAPGVYTAQVAGKSDGTGTALVEVYDADPE